MATLKIISRQNKTMNPLSDSHKYHDDYAVDDVIRYCIQYCKTPSRLIGGYAVNIDQAAYEMHRLAAVFGKDTGLRLRHMILSFSNQEIQAMGANAPEYVFQIADYAARYYGFDYQIIFAVHEDTGNLHTHLVMSTVNYNTGQKYGGKKEDFYAFISYLSIFLWEQYGLCLKVVPDKEIPRHTW